MEVDLKMPPEQWFFYTNECNESKTNKGLDLLLIHNNYLCWCETLQDSFCDTLERSIKTVALTELGVNPEMQFLYSCLSSLYLPQTNLQEGNIFTRVCHSVHREMCVHGWHAWRRGHEWWREASLGKGESSVAKGGIRSEGGVHGEGDMHGKWDVHVWVYACVG